MNKFEKLIEYIINDEDQKARELFHSIVVEKSRDIYESIMDQENEGYEESVHGDQVGDMVDEISHEETMEDDEEFEVGAEGGEDEFAGDEFGGDEVGGDELGGDELGGDEVGGEQDVVMNIDAKLDELLAKFDEIMGDEGASGAEGGDEFGGEEELGGDEEFDGAGQGDAEFGGDEGEEETVAEAVGSGASGSAKSGKSGKSGSGVAEAFGKSGSAISGKSGKSGSATSGKSGSAKSGKSGKPFEGKKSTAELMREYVDRIGDIYGGQGDATEGDPVGGTGKKVAVNKKSGSVGPGADFGGTNQNIARGKANENPDGKQVPKPSNEYSKGEGKLPGAGKFQNVPGGDKSPKATGEKYESKPEGQENKSAGAGTGSKDKPSVNAKSVQKQNTGIKK